jgi:hypothetical protein
MRQKLEQTKHGQNALKRLATIVGETRVDATLAIIDTYIGTRAAWDGDFNRDGRLPFNRTTLSQRLAAFLRRPSYVSEVKGELARQERARNAAEAKARIERHNV